MENAGQRLCLQMQHESRKGPFLMILVVGQLDKPDTFSAM